MGSWMTYWFVLDFSLILFIFGAVQACDRARVKVVNVLSKIEVISSTFIKQKIWSKYYFLIEIKMLFFLLFYTRKFNYVYVD